MKEQKRIPNYHILQSLEWLVKAASDYLENPTEGNRYNLKQAINESK